MKTYKITLIYLLITLLLPLESNAQTIKTYKGPLVKPKSMICSITQQHAMDNVTYSYYEDSDGARVWHGSVSIPRATLSSAHGAYGMVIGRYEHGKQAGEWTEIISRESTSNFLKYNFKNGKLNGQYLFQDNSLTITATLKDNRVVGPFLFKDKQGWLAIEGQFDDHGFATGLWTMRYKSTYGIQYVRKYTYDSGVALRIIEIDNSTGEKSIFREATKSEYGTIIINDKHHKVVTITPDVEYRYTALRNNEVEFSVNWYEDYICAVLDKNMPLFGWIEYLTHNPFAGLKECNYEELAEIERLEAMKQTTICEEDQHSEDIYTTVDRMPMFNGEDANFFITWTQSLIKYPQEAIDSGIQGNVVVSFVVEVDGTLSNIMILKSPDELLSNEVIRILKLSPKWEAGIHNGNAVRVKYTIPIAFRLQ